MPKKIDSLQTTQPKEQQTEEPRAQTQARKADLASRQLHLLAAENEIRFTFTYSGIGLMGVKEIETGCLWVGVNDEKKRYTLITKILSRVARKQLFDCLTIVDYKQNEIRRIHIRE
ncbi:hypothetical protein GCM10028805_15940 [Spirosoma harenae]